MADKKPVDPAKAGEKLANAQEAIKLTHAAMQACTKAWDGAPAPGPIKRAAWSALCAMREAFGSAVKEEERHFNVMKAIVGQGDLFNDGIEQEEKSEKPSSPAGAGAALALRRGSRERSGAEASH